jgi:hypothetical protein
LLNHTAAFTFSIKIGKAIPLQAWTGLKGSRKLRFPDFKTRVQFSDPYKNVGKTKVLYISKIVSVLTFLKIVQLIVPVNCKNFANLKFTSLENS